MKRLIIDIYAEMDFDDVGSELLIDVGEVRDPETGDVYTGKFIIKDLELKATESLESNL